MGSFVLNNTHKLLTHLPLLVYLETMSVLKWCDLTSERSCWSSKEEQIAGKMFTCILLDLT